MSKMTSEVGPPLESGRQERMRASVTAVGTSPSSSTRSAVPVGKKGRTRVKDATNMRGSCMMTDSCSKMTAGEWKEARKATCWLRISIA